MNIRIRRPALSLAAVAALAVTMPAASHAQGDWEGEVTLYGWLPTMGGTFHFPVAGSVDAELDPSDVLNALNFAFFTTAEVRKDRWGALTDVIYLDLGNTKRGLRDLTIGDQELPAQLQTKTEVSLKGWVWTLGGTYVLSEDAAHPVSLVAGARLIDLTNELKLDVTGDITGTPLPGRRVRGEANLSNWDAVVGLKGRMDLGEAGAWFVPYYADIGTGESDLTWQAVLGVGYAFDWGDLAVAWRYMDYDFGSDDPVEDLWQSGVALGATFHF
jgi:hypothetical protein